MTDTMHIAVKSVRTNGGTQSRAAINDAVVAEYAEAIADGAEFPRIKVFFDGTDYWLADGFHRLGAYARADRQTIPAEVEQGTRREAILHSVGANASHGLRRTNDDKRRAVLTLLNDQEWSGWNDSQIGRQCHVDHKTVARIRKDLPDDHLGKSQDSRKVERGGKTYEQNTANIGKAKATDDAQGQEPTGPAAQPEPETEAEDYDPVHAEKLDEPQPEPIPDPYGYGKLTDDALLETANGLREECDELRKRVTTQTNMIADLKSQIKELTSDEDTGRKIGSLQRRLTQSEGRSKEHQTSAARLQRQVNGQKSEIAAQKAEIEKLKKSLENQEIAL